MSDKEPYCEGGYRGCPTMKQIEELREALVEIRDFHGGLGSDAWMAQRAAKAIKESGDADGP